MTSYAPTFTPRLRVHYIAAGVEHSIQVRYPRGTTGASLAANVDAINAIFGYVTGALADDFEFTSAEYALTDEDVFTACAPPVAVTGTIDAATFTPIQKIVGTTFSGRSPGSRAKFTMFGLFWEEETLGNAADNGLITAAEVAAIGSVATYATGHFMANSGLAAVFYQKATIKPNDHLLRLVRRGIIS